MTARRKVDRRRWYFALFNLLLVVLAAVCGGLFWWISGWLNSLDAADRWRGQNEMTFAQIGCYLPVDDPASTEEIFKFRRTLEEKLTQDSLAAPDGGSLYADAWSASARVQVATDFGSAQVRATGVGGNFFLFHPLQLRSGSYLSEDDLMQDRVILDETLAWTLFGSPDVAGMTVSVNGTQCYVAGVIRQEQDPASRTARGEEASLYLSWDMFRSLTEQDATCYEIVLPNVISGYGMGLVKESFDIGTGDLTENSRRYSLQNLLTVAGDFGVRSMRHNGVIYPEWENAARMTEDYLAALLILGSLLLACPVITVTVELIRSLVKTGKYVQKKVPETADRLIERRREERYANKTK